MTKFMTQQNNKANAQLSLAKESIDLYKSSLQHYGSREYCHDTKCTVQTMLNYLTEKGYPLEGWKEHCRGCEAYKFHKWLEAEGYEITRSNIR